MTNEQTKTEMPLIRLATRICASPAVCAVCGKRYTEPGLPAAFIAEEDDFAELDRYVCEQCAESIDASLADYIYNANHIPEKRTLANSDGNYFGDCPECGAAGICINIGPDHWLVCFKHGVRWRVGSNLFS